MHQSININQIKITSDPEQDSVVPIAFVGFLTFMDRLHVNLTSPLPGSGQWKSNVPISSVPLV
jgi:uncharacterized membrane protein